VQLICIFETAYTVYCIDATKCDVCADTITSAFGTYKRKLKQFFFVK
jgi:hypothetical protein